MEKSSVDAELEFREYVQDECRFGIRILEPGQTHEGLRNLHKRATSKDEEEEFGTYVTNVETLVSPTYRMYVTGPEDLLDDFEDALVDPERLLYLGRSDDLVDIRDVDQATAELVEEVVSIDCAIPGAGETPTMLPVEPDSKEGRTTEPSRVKTISAQGGEVDAYYETQDGERIAFLT
jgi:CRISPR/Cas system-associated protein Cas5 (RAMP superfamily)